MQRKSGISRGVVRAPAGAGPASPTASAKRMSAGKAARTPSGNDKVTRMKSGDVADAGALPEYRWQVELDPDFAFYYLRVQNGKCFSVTAPVYLAGREALTVTDVTIGAAQTGKDPHTVRVCLQNKGTKTLHKVTTDLYLSSPDGFHLRELSPYLSLTTDKLAAGETRELVTTLPDVPTRNRLTVVASGQAGSAR